MDPFTALSLACGIIQVVDFSTKAVTKCRELYKDGSSSENEDFEEMANHLLSLCASLDVPNQQSLDELQELARKCSDTAEDLIKELRKLKIKRPRRKLEVASKAIRTLWKKEAIDEIWKRLENYRNILNAHILIHLRRRFDLSSLQQNKDFKNLDEQIQIMIRSLAAGFKGCDQLATAIHGGCESIKVHVVHEFQQHQRYLAHKDYCRRYLESLSFPDMKRRQETIKEAHEMTFQWIFKTKETRVEARRWDDFVQWLENDHRTYWINGKAGSGKSTLMNYIYQDDRTHNSLQAWSGTKALCTLGFFFWNAGSNMEKSSEGLLRSLLYQVLEKYPDLTPPPDRASSKPHTAGDGPIMYGPFATWTEGRLQTILPIVMRELQESCRICIFIDGLDEFVGDQDALIATLKKLQSSEIKLCLSSRPDQPYSDAFGSSETLKLQDLTRADIGVFVSDKLQARRQAEFAKDVTNLVDIIVSKAEGIFLWVDLVVKDVLRGLNNGDSLEQLDYRVSLMPSDIEELYAHMLNKIDNVYQEDAAKLFNMVLNGLTQSLLNVSLALYEVFDLVPQTSIQDAISFCKFTTKRIPTICAGLVEIHIGEILEPCWNAESAHLSVPFRDEPSPELAEISLYERSYHVGFIHRTSDDFLRNSEQGQRFMSEHSPSSWNPYDSYVRGLLAKASLLGFPKILADTVHELQRCEEPRTVEAVRRDFVREVMDKAALAEQYTGTAQVLLCDDIDRTLAFVYQQRSDHSMNDHWCVQLGNDQKAEWSIDSVPSSRSSSEQSFHSAMSEQLGQVRHERLSTKPVDILGLACSHGLFHYVCHALQTRRDLHDQETATHLLCCSMWALDSISSYVSGSRIALNRMRGSMRLICEFLKRGADPNFYFNNFSATIWRAFLLRFMFWLRDDKSACAKISKVFVDHGADVHRIVYTSHLHNVEGIAFLKRHVEWDPSERRTFCTLQAESELFILQEALSGTPDFEALEKACQSKGALSFSRHSHVRHPDENGYWRRYEMTDLQCSKFEAAMKKNHHSRTPHETAESIRLQLKYARQIARIWAEITNDDDTDCQDDSNEETTSDSAEESHSSSSRMSLSA